MNHQNAHSEILEFVRENGNLDLYLRLRDYSFLILGQRFCMSLNEETKAKLISSPWDPFYNHDVQSVLRAVYYLKGFLK